MAIFFPANFKGENKWKILTSSCRYLKILEGSKLKEEIKYNLWNIFFGLDDIENIAW